MNDTLLGYLRQSMNCNLILKLNNLNVCRYHYPLPKNQYSHPWLYVRNYERENCAIKHPRNKKKIVKNLWDNIFLMPKKWLYRELRSFEVC